MSETFWRLFSLGIFSSFLVIVFFIVKDELSGIYKEKREAKEKLEIKGEFEALGYLAASIQHELRNPLQAMKDEINKLKIKFQNDEKFKDKFYPLEIQVDRMSLAANIIKVLRFKKEDFANKLRETKVIDRIKSSIKYVKKEIPSYSEKVSITENEKTKELFIMAAPTYLEQAFINLLKNSYEAIDRTGKRGEIFIDLYLIDKNTVRITFTDTGDGFIPEDIPNLTNPNYTKKDTIKSEANRGLGLFVCDKIVYLNNGTIDFSNSENGGAKVKLEFPRHFTKRMQKTDAENN